MKRKAIVIAVVAWIAVAWVAMNYVSYGRDGGTTHLVSEADYKLIQRYSRLDEVRRTLEESYYVEVDEETLVTGAIRGMMDSLGDPYTFYYTAEEMRAANEEAEGIYHGIGMLVQITEDEMIEIVRVYEDAPAEAAGVLAGDRVVTVDGVAVSGENAKALDEAISLIQGEDGTSVRLGLLRDGKIIELDVMRAEVNVSYISYQLIGNDVGYINLTQFTGDAVTGFEEAMSTFRYSDVKGIVVDLRSNPGGMLDQVVDIADLVLPEGLITYVEDRQGNRREELSDADYWDIPMVVLVNDMSASASELFSAAVQDYDRATVVGTTTFGKGIVQTMITFADDGAGMQLTTESYYSPNGRSIHKTGVEPDVVVELSEDSFIGLEPDPENDNQLAVALEELEKRIEQANNAG